LLNDFTIVELSKLGKRPIAAFGLGFSLEHVLHAQAAVVALVW